MYANSRRVLLCTRYGIGDVVMELPVVEALRRSLPQAHITALAATPAVQILERHPGLNAVATLQQWGILHRWDRGPAGVERTISVWLDENDFDLFLDLHHVAPIFGQVVRSRGGRVLEADEKVERAEVQRGENGVTAIKRAVRAGWGIEVPERSLPRVPLQRQDEAFADEFLRESGFGARAPLAISPVAAFAVKRWPTERLAHIADWLVEQTGEPLLAFCGPQEGAGHALRRQMRHGECVVCVGPVHLLRVAALLARCRAFVCNDTGLMHLAAAVGIPTVAIFGPTAPAIYRPPADDVVSVGGEAVDCPHHNTASLHPPRCFGEGRCLIADEGCIQQTTEDEVKQSIQQLLGSIEQPARHSRSVA